MGRLAKLLRDLRGLATVLGPAIALRWLLLVLRELRSILRARHLQPADLAMGEGPFRVQYRKHIRFRIAGLGAFSGIREMYVRDTYLRGGILTIDDRDVVVDLGSNMGNFCNLALAHGPDVTVVAVEPSEARSRVMQASLALNPGFSQRVSLIRAFLGAPADKQLWLPSDPSCAGAQWMDEGAFLEQAGISKVDFLKCDIEGGEFALLHPASRLLALARKLAIEIHAFAGKVDAFIAMLQSQGFDVLYIQRDPDGSATVLAKRRQQGFLQGLAI